MAEIPRITVKGVEIHFEGDHPRTVVMLHGWPDTYRLWDTTVAALKDRYCCVRFTLPGFDTAAPARITSLDDMCELLQTLVDQVSPGVPVTLLLHDWGCAFGYEFAARFPDRVSRIVAVDVGDHNAEALVRELTPLQRAQVFGYQFWLALAWKIGGSTGTWMTRWMARQLGCRSDPALIGWQMNYPYAMRWFGSAGGLARALPVPANRPMLFIYGERKPFMFHSPQWLAALAARADCAVRAFPTGHWVMVQQPQAFNQCVRAWLQASDARDPLPVTVPPVA
jgi:cis-3-alkyl-4-acyloxetan-2-one decarboxylase